MYMPTLIDLVTVRNENLQAQLTMLRKALNDSPEDHNTRAQHNRPPSTKSLVEPWSNWDGKDRSELIARRNKSEKRRLDGILACSIFVTLTKIFVEWTRELQRVDELRIESRGHLYSHTAEEEPDIHDTQITLAIPWYFVLLGKTCDDRVGETSGLCLFGESHHHEKGLVEVNLSTVEVRPRQVANKPRC